MRKKIGIVVGNYFEVPHETEQINAQVMKREIEKLGSPVSVFYFNGDFVGRGVFPFSRFFKSDVEEVYLSGKISNKNFFKLVLFCFLKDCRIHFRIPSYRLDLFKKYRFFLNLLVRRGTLKLYSYDEVHREFIGRELGFEAEVLGPMADLGDRKNLKKDIDVLFVGSLNDLKRGLKDLIMAMKIVKKKYPKVLLKIISRYEIYTKKKEWFASFEGRRAEVIKEIKDLVKEAGLEKNVLFSGKVDDVGDEYERARVYVLPVREFDKMPPIPFTILESLHYGTSVVSKDFWGIGLILDDEYLVDKDLRGEKLHRDLAMKIVKVLKERPKGSLDKKFTPRETAKEFLKFVEEG